MLFAFCFSARFFSFFFLFLFFFSRALLLNKSCLKSALEKALLPPSSFSGLSGTQTGKRRKEEHVLLLLHCTSRCTPAPNKALVRCSSHARWFRCGVGPRENRRERWRILRDARRRVLAEDAVDRRKGRHPGDLVLLTRGCE